MVRTGCIACIYCRSIAGGAHAPEVASGFGAYKRMINWKSPSGAGSQFDTRALPGDVA
jgi:hypothetical protein